jgi:hypothetical protein
VQVRSAPRPDSSSGDHLDVPSDLTTPNTAPDNDAESAPGGLSERDIAILAFERQWWRNPSVKEEAIRAEFGLSAARYYQVLGALVDSPLALAHDPMLIKRLQRMREARAEARARRSVISRNKD